MNKITIYVKDLNEAQEVLDWLRENVGWENYQQWISVVTDNDWTEHDGIRRTYSFKNPEHATLFALRWA